MINREQIRILTIWEHSFKSHNLVLRNGASLIFYSLFPGNKQVTLKQFCLLYAMTLSKHRHSLIFLSFCCVFLLEFFVFLYLIEILFYALCVRFHFNILLLLVYIAPDYIGGIQFNPSILLVSDACWLLFKMI